MTDWYLTGGIGQAGSAFDNMLQGIGFPLREVEEGGGGLIVSVDSFGAAGDGVTNDTNAIQNAINAAGPGARLFFTSNATYLLGGSINPLPGQIIDLNGATLKRIDQSVTTTTGAISSGAGPTNITLADATGFDVGNDIIAWKSDGTQVESYPHKITARNGNVITVDNQWIVNIDAGSNVALGGSMIRHAVHDGGGVASVLIQNGKLDGNRANNTQGKYWECFTAILLESDDGIVRRIEVADSPVEGIVASGNTFRVAECHIHDCGGNGVHANGTGGNFGMMIYRNRITTCNLDGLGDPPGHADGAISISSPINRVMIEGNYIEECAQGIGGFNEVTQQALVANNIFYNISGDYLKFTSNPQAELLSFVGNQFVHPVISGGALVNIDGQASGRGTMLFSGNFFKNVRIQALNMGGVAITGNHFYCSTVGSGGLGQGVVITDARDCQIQGNKFDGFQRGVSVQSGDSKNLKISGNLITRCYSGGVMVTQGGNGIDISANEIQIADTDSMSSSWVGILADDDNTVVANRIECTKTTVGARGIVGSAGGVGVNAAIIHGNRVKMGDTANQATIELPASSQNNYVQNNYVNKAVNDLGTGNTVATNQVVN